MLNNTHSFMFMCMMLNVDNVFVSDVKPLTKALLFICIAVKDRCATKLVICSY